MPAPLSTTAATPLVPTGVALGFEGISSDAKLIWMAVRRGFKGLSMVIADVARRRRDPSLALLAASLDAVSETIERRCM